MPTERKKKFINTGSMRFQFFSFIGLLLLILLLLLNLYPYFSTRDAVYQEKEKSMESQAATLASALAGLTRPDQEGVAEVLRLLDIRDYDRVIVTDREGNMIYNVGSGEALIVDLETALGGKTVFRSALRGESFSSSYTMPISAQGTITGAVLLHEDDDERGQILHDLQV